MRGLQDGNDAFFAAEGFKGVQRFIIGRGDIVGTSDAVQVRMLWPYGGEVQAGGNGTGLNDLPLIGLHHRRFQTEIDTRATVLEWRAMLAGFNAVTSRLHADQTDTWFINKVGKHSNRVRSPSHAGDNRIRHTAFSFQNLHPGLFSNHALEFTNNSWEGTWTRGCSEHEMRLFIATGPVAKRLVGGIFPGRGTAVYRDHLRPHQAHPEDVRRLTLDILCTHINATFQAKQCAGERRGDTVLPGPGFGNDFSFSQALCQQRLAQNLVGFVRAAVEQIFTFEVQRGAGPSGEIAAQG